MGCGLVSLIGPNFAAYVWGETLAVSPFFLQRVSMFVSRAGAPAIFQKQNSSI
jgi:hypothetical protein